MADDGAVKDAQVEEYDSHAEESDDSDDEGAKATLTKVLVNGKDLGKSIKSVWAVSSKDKAFKGLAEQSADYATVLAALRKFDVPLSGRKNTVKFKGQEQRGCCVGALGARWRGIIPGKSSIMFPEFTKVLVAFAKKHGPPGFKFTSIQINKNYASGLHVDKNNMGDSQIVGLGDYTEGGLWVHDQGALDVKKKFVAFDGNVPHATLDFEGERFSLIYFVQAQFRQMRDEHKEYLINDLGFPFPDDDVVGRTYETAETRLAAAKKAFGVFNAARQAAMPPSGSTRSSAKATPQVKRAAAAALPRLKARPRPTYAKGSARPKARARPSYK